MDTCKNNGKELTVLGFNDIWTGFNMKFKKMMDYLKTLPPNDIGCFVDGYDVICLRNLNQLINVFELMIKKHNCKIIAGYDNDSHDKYQLIFKPIKIVV